MPTVREQLTDKALSLLELDAGVIAYFTRAGNRLAAGNKETWLRDTIARAPADFPRFTLDFSRGSHSMYTAATGFAADSTTFHTSGTAFDVNRVFTLQITIKELQPKSGVINAPEEVVLAALFKAGTRFGLPAIVYTIGEARYERRDSRQDEMPSPGTVTTIQLPITTQESGLALLT